MNLSLIHIYCDADIAIQNGGGIRAGLTAGDVTVGDIFGMLPFDNKVTLVEVTGQTVWEALENGVDAYPELNGKFPQVSGIQYTFDASKPCLLYTSRLRSGGDEGCLWRGQEHGLPSPGR